MEIFFEFLMTFLFVITFYFTILRYITNLKIFNISINNWHSSLGIKENTFTVFIDWSMWFFQITFWLHYFNIIK